MIADTAAVRIDKWLWAARFFKTRSLASQAVQGGKVHVNGGRVRPSRIVAQGDVLEIRRDDSCFTVVVQGITPYRRPAKEAQLLYAETEESIARRAEARELRRLIGAPAAAPAGRPDKRDRRKIRQFIKKA